MSQVKIGTKDGRTSFRPGEVIEGAAGWELTEPTKFVEVRLFWYTKGQGTEDVEVVDRVRFENPALQDAEAFRFVAPDQPYSFSGQLFSLTWALELVVEPGERSARQDIVISATGAEVVLKSVRASHSSPRK